MKWLEQNLMVIIVIGCLIYMIIKFFYEIIRNLKREYGNVPSEEIPDCSPILAQYLIKDGIIDKNSIFSILVNLCHKKYILVKPILGDKKIEDFELIKNGIPEFKEDEYEKNLFNKEFLNADITLSDLYAFNKYIFMNKERVTLQDVIKNLNIKFSNEKEDKLMKILAAEILNSEIILTDKNGETEFTENGEKVLRDVNGLKLYLKKYDVFEKLEKQNIEKNGKYYEYGLVFGTEIFNIHVFEKIYNNGYFD